MTFIVFSLATSETNQNQKMPDHFMAAYWFTVFAGVAHLVNVGMGYLEYREVVRVL